MEILKGHISPETAYVVEDYPYGFRLRCKIRYWLEFVKNKGVRFWSQTTNPKKGNVWNKPKASTYSLFGGCMYLNYDGHVTWSGLSEYCSATEAQTWSDNFRDGTPEACLPTLDEWVRAKRVYEQRRATAGLAIG